ncbi:hypothetical protein GGX14DRAFT_644215 [Mycena pura]|uniref:Uncharacterized protein n=1 Tax=Mycena pura TaxID=153505 RepID=A0AAD6V839_9AGAR|nr:hypothetical protein GGX14DRAFT_644215 [Mycena pura]
MNSHNRHRLNSVENSKACLSPSDCVGRGGGRRQVVMRLRRPIVLLPICKLLVRGDSITARTDGARGARGGGGRRACACTAQKVRSAGARGARCLMHTPHAAPRSSSRATRRTRAHSPARAAGIEQAAQGVKRERAEVCSAGSRGAMSRARAPRSPTQHYSAAQLLRHVDDPLESADARAVGTEHAEHAHGARGARRGGETMARVLAAIARVVEHAALAQRDTAAIRTRAPRAQCAAHAPRLPRSSSSTRMTHASGRTRVLSSAAHSEGARAHRGGGGRRARRGAPRTRAQLLQHANSQRWHVVQHAADLRRLNASTGRASCTMSRARAPSAAQLIQHADDPREWADTHARA